MLKPADLLRFAQYPSLKGRVVLITGGASGIGADIVRGFVHQGTTVCFLDVLADSAASLARQLESEGATAPVFRHCDLTDIKNLKQTIKELTTEFGPAEVLVNNAANDDRHRIEEVTNEYWDRQMAVNLKHYFFTAQSVVEGMKKRGAGSIINIGSISSRFGSANLALYASANAGICGLTRSLARDFGGHGIRVNTIVPGSIVTTRQRQKWLTPELSAEHMNAQCLKRLIDPVHVANMVLFLAADDSERCSGREYFVDAGWL